MLKIKLYQWSSYRFVVGISVFAFLMLSGCGGGKKAIQADARHIQKTIDYLASDALLGRDTGSEGIEMAADFLEEALKSYGVTPFFNSYRDTLSTVDVSAFNIVGYIPGADDRLEDGFIVLGAHYDHIGITKAVEDDSIANGANDNASGTAMLLELARNLAVKKPKRGILIAFFSAEERGLLGSVHLAKKLKDNGDTPFAMLNFEMVGVPMKNTPYQLYLTGYEMSNLADLSNQFGGEGLIGLLPQAQEYNLFERSDNYAFYKEFGVPSHTYSTFDFTNYAFYHQPGDEANKMNVTHMTSLVTQMIPVIMGVSNMPEDQLKVK